ncbi:unnamed protein product [Nezara viridula]|uniref:Transcription factor Dp-1 n=1 Tax=Nezara viridula TaxID=85310 RepID=A0A9P0MNI1_NEZVI|nr:unnamed protein product [Nezara viridula]
MAHQPGTMNLLIQDTNGNPQLIKVQKSQPKSAKQETLKILSQHKPGTLAQVVNASSGSIIPQGAQVLRAVAIQGKQRQLFTIPAITQFQNILKPERQSAPQTTKTIQLPSQSVQVLPNPSKNYIAPILDSGGNSRKRKDSENGDYVPEFTTGVKRRKSDKGGKGLRHFSMKVCEKVRKKGTTSYNEVADELVSEFTNPNLIPNSVDQQYDQKNIRRRVYDALNVLMAMNIIAKEKKEIRWLGLPTTSAQECGSLINEKKSITERIQVKTHQLNELLLQQISYKNLIQRNFEMEKTKGPPPPNSAIHLPFIVVNSDRKTVIDCSITNDKTEYLFVFNDKFEIHDDFEILKQIGLTHGLENGDISEANLAKIKSMLPKSMEKYVTKMAESSNNLNGYKDESPYSIEFVESAGTSTDSYLHAEDLDSTVEETSDDESNISTDIDIN